MSEIVVVEALREGVDLPIAVAPEFFGLNNPLQG